MAVPQKNNLDESKLNPQQRVTTTTKQIEVVDTSSLSPENQDYWYYCWRHSYNPYESGVQGDVRTNFHDKKWKHQRKMDTLICNSYDMLKEYFDPNLYPNHQIPHDLFQTCKAIILLRVWKAGVFIGGIGGTGIILLHKNGNWSNPCAISIGGIQLGLHLGVERVDDILLLHDDSALSLLFEKGYFKFGADASIAVGPYGRDTNLGVAMSGKESKSIYSYSFAKGAFIGLSLDGGSLTVNDSVNEEFYGRKINVKDILYGDNIDMSHQIEDFNKLKQLLNDYCLNLKTNPQQPVINDNITINKKTDFNPIANQ